VNGQAVELLLDTGAEATVLSPGLLGVADETLGSAEEICFGEMCLQNEPIYAWETPFSSASGEGPSGFIGMHTLKELRFELDGTQATLALGGGACSGTSVELVFSEFGIPMVDVTAHTLPVASIPIDTGATYTLFSQATSDALGVALEPKEPAPLCTVDGCQPNGAFTSLVPSYCIGSECETDVSVKFPAFDAVGMTYFARRHVQFDFSDSLLRFCTP
jgi:predicted aspartyl protease